MATVGSGQFTYGVDKDWGRRSSGVPTLGLVSGVACDSADRVYLFIRRPTSMVMVFERDGRFLAQWGEGQFGEAHGIWISPQDEVYLTDSGAHLVTKWTADGTLLHSWGTRDRPGAPGAPFNRPTRAVVSPAGEMYVSDGYGQHRVHRFGPDGQLALSWGERGSGPGQFTLPHDVWVDPRDRVVVCDREENHRIQFFDRDGGYLSEWPERRMPMQVFVRDDVLYLAEGQQRITIMTLDGEVLAQWGSKGPGPDQFTDAPHSIWVDSHGDIYVSEVVAENKLQKYTRR
jgi:DNA-binding beta-propeller fold protein YncE